MEPQRNWSSDAEKLNKRMLESRVRVGLDLPKLSSDPCCKDNSPRECASPRSDLQLPLFGVDLCIQSIVTVQLLYSILLNSGNRTSQQQWRQLKACGH